MGVVAGLAWVRSGSDLSAECVMSCQTMWRGVVVSLSITDCSHFVLSECEVIGVLRCFQLLLFSSSDDMCTHFTVLLATQAHFSKCGIPVAISQPSITFSLPQPPELGSSSTSLFPIVFLNVCLYACITHACMHVCIPV